MGVGRPNRHRLRFRLRAAAVAALSVALSATGAPANKKKKAKHARHERQPEFPANAPDSKACATAALSPSGCLEELTRRGVHFRKAEPAPGVLTPVRLLGPVGGVLYRTDYSDAQRSTVPFEVFDCRLVVALSDVSPILREHEIDEVRLFSAWRPPPKGLAAGKILDAHPGGLAADLRLFKKSSGADLDVEADFHGRIGAEPCGHAAIPPTPATDGARELRSILCSIADARLVHVLLSPNFDARHRNHFHVEVRPGVRWFIVR
jgi:hypothetical protein